VLGEACVHGGGWRWCARDARGSVHACVIVAFVCQRYQGKCVCGGEGGGGVPGPKAATPSLVSTFATQNQSLMP